MILKCHFFTLNGTKLSALPNRVDETYVSMISSSSSSSSSLKSLTEHFITETSFRDSVSYEARGTETYK